MALYGALTEQQKRKYGPLLMDMYQQRAAECRRRLNEEDMQKEVYRPPASLVRRKELLKPAWKMKLEKLRSTYCFVFFSMELWSKTVLS